MANRMIRDQLVQPLELIHMPNAGRLLEPLKDVSFDPGRKYSLTWQSGFAGIGYDKSKVGRELKSLDDLWADDLKGKITSCRSSATPSGSSCSSQGVDISGNFTKDQVRGRHGEVDQAHRRRQHPPDQGQRLHGGPQERQRHRRHRLER
jgi:spermidine/putrescine transport system substrate-binding protein